MEETVQRIEPARLADVAEPISDALAELSASSAVLGAKLHPRTRMHRPGQFHVQPFRF